jgi:hypothetical protein
MTNSEIFQSNGKSYRTEKVTDRYGDTYTAWIPCGPKGGKVDTCPVCGGHADHRQGIGCGLG